VAGDVFAEFGAVRGDGSVAEGLGPMPVGVM
jgi:hypothetical protein